MRETGRWIAVTGVVLAVTGLIWGGKTDPLESQRLSGAPGVVNTASGEPLSGVTVTAQMADGRTTSVYTDAAGRFWLPEGATRADSIIAWAPGVGRGALAPENRPNITFGLTLSPSDPVSPSGAAWLSTLPDSETRRRFILDCTGCHVTDATRVEINGMRRDSAAWAGAINRMRAQFGPGTGFPIISDWPGPATLAPWLAEHFGAARPATGLVSGPTRLARGDFASPEEPASQTVLTEYPFPVPQDLPHDLAVDAAGQVVVTGMFSHAMWVLDPETGRFEQVPIPIPGANPRAVDIDSRGRWWVVLGGPGRVAIHDPSEGSWIDHDVGMYAHSIALDRDGRGWVNGHFTRDPELIAMVDDTGGSESLFEIAGGMLGGADPGGLRRVPDVDESTIPYGLRAASNGMIWGTQLRGNGLIRLDPASGESRRWEMPIGHSGPRRPDVDAQNRIWIPLYSANAVARFDPTTEEFDVWDFPIDGALPYVVRVEQGSGRVWIGTGHGDVAASFDPASEEFTLYPLPTRGALVRHLDIDEGRNEIWFAYGASPGIPGRILRLQPGD